MTVKEWLNKSRTMERELKQLEELKGKAYSLACGGSDSTNRDERVQTSKKNSTDDKFAAYADYSRQVDEMTAQLIKYRGELLIVLSGMENEKYKFLLIERYINCKTWEQVSDSIGLKDVRHIYRLHKKALRSVKIPSNE